MHLRRCCFSALFFLAKVTTTDAATRQHSVVHLYTCTLYIIRDGQEDTHSIHRVSLLCARSLSLSRCLPPYIITPPPPPSYSFFRWISSFCVVVYYESQTMSECLPRCPIPPPPPRSSSSSMSHISEHFFWTCVLDSAIAADRRILLQLPHILNSRN